MKNILTLCSFLLLVSPPLHAADGESIPAGEAAQIPTIESMIDGMVRAQATRDGTAHRDAHAKAHGCVYGTFTVDGGLTPELAVGVFKEPRSFDAIARFSNGSGRSDDDSVGDGRGMAIKLLGVEGEKIMDDEKDAQTQDFVMINHPTFFVRNASDYIGFQKALISGSALSAIGFFAFHLHEAFVLHALTSRKVSSPLDTPYWSMTPYKLSERQMKYSVSPCNGSPSDRDLPRQGPDFLRQNMRAELAGADRCFDFFIQLRTSPSMPIEDPTIEWSERESPYRKVARLTIPQQSFDSAAQLEACENLSMTPWHALPELRPLGGINRVRKVVYQHVSKLRHELNRVERREP